MNRTVQSRPVQRFSDEYLERCRELSPEDIVQFLEEFRIVIGSRNAHSRLADIAWEPAEDFRSTFSHP